MPDHKLPVPGAKEPKDHYQPARTRTPEEIEALGADAGAFLKNPPIEEGIRITGLVRQMKLPKEAQQALFNMLLEATARGYALGRESCKPPKLVTP